MNKQYGILMPLAALPSDYGVGDLGKNAYKFIDILSANGAKIWQILPFSPLGFGNSPYQSTSSFAGDNIYIDLEWFYEKGLINKELLVKTKSSNWVDYFSVRKNKEKIFNVAYANFSDNEALDNFIKKYNWVENYAKFAVLKKINYDLPWNKWTIFEIKNTELIKKEIFLQYVFFTQWFDLKHYANKNSIKIMGDVPFYVPFDSADFYYNKEQFLVDENFIPTFIGGVPPDYFSKTGQRWGNPIYNWEVMKESNYSFWVNRMQENSRYFDVVRIDHFRAFDTYWKIPSHCPTAIEGEWVEAPGYEVLKEIQKYCSAKIIAEDLGDMRPEVELLRKHFNFPGMKIIQFSLDPNETNNDFDDYENMLIYSGTHDNQTTLGWYQTQNSETKEQITNLFKNKNYSFDNPVDNIIEGAFASVANWCIIPAWDVLTLPDQFRYNIPGTISKKGFWFFAKPIRNWEWKLVGFSEFEKDMKKLKFLKEKYDR